MNLTIFIITFNRPKFVDLIIRYFLERNFDCNLIFVDGSENPFKKDNLKIIKNYRKIYKKKIGYVFSKNQLKAIHSLVKKISTKYCLFSNDDDLPGKNFLEESIDFLDNNKNYITTNGNMATANIKFSAKKYELSNFRFAEVKTLNINADSVDKRYLRFNYQEGFVYGVYRKKDFKNIFSIIEKLCKIIKNPVKKIEHWISFKLLTITFATYNLLNGNIRSSKKLMMTRLNHIQFIQSSSIDYYDKFGGWYINDFYKDNDVYNKFLSKQLAYFFKKIKEQTILNLIYLHIYMRASTRLPRYFYHVHKSICPKAFNFSEKFLILRNYPEYIYFKVSRIISKLFFFDKLIFLIENKKEIDSLKKFFRK